MALRAPLLGDIFFVVLLFVFVFCFLFFMLCLLFVFVVVVFVRYIFIYVFAFSGQLTARPGFFEQVNCQGRFFRNKQMSGPFFEALARDHLSGA